MSTHESAAAQAAPIPRSALVAGAGCCQPELTRDLRTVAMDAASQWTRTQAISGKGIDGSPEEFGAAVARVYLAALRELEAGFGPAPKREW
ncbi:hypothetical protein [Alicycliphilus denitrificans]|uniref:hypothetical protein n=1 Tax=Alicycliphilus denitrificans TaxID=179636 RepID=UPI00384E48C9